MRARRRRRDDWLAGAGKALAWHRKRTLGLDLAEVAKRAKGRFTARRLSNIEKGRWRTLSLDEARAVLDAYGINYRDVGALAAALTGRKLVGVLRKPDEAAKEEVEITEVRGKVCFCSYEMGRIVDHPEMAVMRTRLEPHQSTKGGRFSEPHVGEELIYVESGELEVHIGAGEPRRLEAGEMIVFKSHTDHWGENHSAESAEYVVIRCPAYAPHVATELGAT